MPESLTKAFCLAAVLASAWACQPSSQSTPEAGSAADPKAAESAEVRILSGGTILTLDDPPRAEALAVRGDRILAVGTLAELESDYPRASAVDLEGRTLLPGFVDSHVHAFELGRDQLLADVVGTTTVAAMVARLRERYPAPEPGTWLVGQGWDEGAWASRGYPDRRELDEAFPDNPVWLGSLHGFAGFANARALELAGIDASTADPEGGTILHREGSEGAGEPTGVLLTLAQNLVRQQIPPDSPEQIREAILAGLGRLAEVGITMVHEAGTRPGALDAYEELARQGRLPIRVYLLLDGNDDALVDAWIERGPAEAGSIDPAGFLTVRGFKVFYDGSLGSRTALLAAPYSDRPERARPTERISVDRVKSLAERAADRGFQMAVHTIGDEGNARILNLYEEVLADHPELDHRWRFEHAQAVEPDFYERAARLGAMASMQPSHAVGDSAWAEDRLGPERIRHAYAWRRMLDAGVPLVLNSDLPGEPWAPMETLYFAVTRKKLPAPGPDPHPVAGEGWYPDQALTVEEALHGMTVLGARAGFDESRLGRLAPGLLADMVELEADPTEVPADSLAGVDVVRVWIAGQPVVDARQGVADARGAVE